MMKTLCLLIFLPILGMANIQEQAETAISEFYSDAQIRFEKFEIPKPLKSEIEQKAGQYFIKDFVYLWKVEQNGTETAYAIVDAVRSKSAFITALILIDSHGQIEQLSILDYQGNHGRQVMNMFWLEQFTGKSATSNLTVGSEIDAVSGATLSAASICKAVKRWCLVVESFR